MELAAAQLCLSGLKAFALSESIHCLEDDKQIGLLHGLIEDEPEPRGAMAGPVSERGFLGKEGLFS